MFSMILNLHPLFISVSNAETKDKYLKIKMQKPALKEEIEKQELQYIRNLPGGIYHAPRFYTQAQSILEDFKSTGRISEDIILKLYFSSDSNVNAWVSQAQISEVKVYNITVTKGLLEIISQPELYQSALGDELVAKIKSRSKSLLAYVIGHELGHVMHGDTDKKAVTTRVYQELAADDFGLRLMADAGYDPDGVIDALEMLGKLHVNKTFAQKVASAMDVHPKPWFRIAALSELVDQLKSSRSARKEMGINAKGQQVINRSQQKIEPRGDEQVSRTSVEVVKRLVESENYKALSPREKERQLEDLLNKVKSTSTNLVTVTGVVATVNAYAQILEQISTIEDIDDLIGSLNRFESKMGSMASSPSSEDDSNAKLAFRNIKAALIDAQITANKNDNSEVNADKPITTLAELEIIGKIVDKKYSMGVLNSMVANCTDINELAKILEFYIHRGFLFKARFNGGGSSSDTELENRFLSKLARRYLHLSQNLEQTMDFIETAIPLAERIGKPEIKSIYPMMAELAQEIVENPQFELGNFVERISNPKTAADKIFSASVISMQENNAIVFIQNREKIKYGNVSSVNNIHHIQSGKNVAQITLTPKQTSFFLLALGQNSGQALITSLTQNKYSTQDVVALLVQRSSKSSEYWSQYQAYLTNPGVKQFANGQLQFQIKSLQSRLLIQRLFEEESSFSPELMKSRYSLADFLAKLSSEGHYTSLWQEITDEMKDSIIYKNRSEIHEVNMLSQFVLNYYSERGFNLIPRLETTLKQLPEAYKDLVELKSNAEKIVSSRVSQNIANIATTVVSDNKTENQNVAKKNIIPILTTKHLETLTVEEKVKLFSDMLETDEQNRILQFGQGVRSELENIKSSFILAVKQREVAESVKDNFISLLEKMLSLADPTLQGSKTEISNEYFELRRELRTYFDALRVSKSNIGDLFNSNSMNYLAGLLDSNIMPSGIEKYGRRMSNMSSASDLIKSFITPNQKTANEILEGNNNLALLNFSKLSGEFALKIAHYEGIDIEELKSKDLIGYYRAKHSPSLNNFTYDPSDKDFIPYSSKAFAEFFQFNEESDLGKILKGNLDKKITNPNLAKFYKSLIEEKWSMFLYRFGTTNDPVEAMLTSSLMLELWKESNVSSKDVNDANARFTFISWSKALALVNQKPDMEAIVFLMVEFSKKLGLSGAVTDFLTTDLSKMFSIYTIKYREKFFNTLIKKIAQYDAWQGQSPDPNTRFKLFISKIIGSAEVMVRIALKVQQILKVLTYYVVRIMPNMYNSIFEPIYYKLAKINIDLLSKGLDRDYFGRTNHAEIFEQIRKQTPWSLDVDNAIYSFIQSPNFAGKKLTQAKREYLVTMVQSIRSLRLREQAYGYLLSEYGEIEVGIGQKISTGIKLLRAYIRAKDLWGSQVIQDLKRADNLFERLKIIEIAWEVKVADRAQRRGINKIDAIQLLTNLKNLAGKFNLPVETEIETMFPEASRHRDEFLDKATKKKSMTVEDLTLVESMKSKNSETPYHLASKVMLELMDEYANILTPLQRSKFILYMSGIEDKVDPEISKILTDRFFATKHRSESAKSKGLKFKLNEIRDFVAETHPEERLVAYRALFLKGISGNKEAEDLLINKLLFADANMPEYLRKVLNIYLKVLKPTELSTRLMWLMSNNAKGESLEGPELLKLLIEYGGVTEKKMAQLIASHGFNLPREYQVVLEVFKGNAQKISKMDFIQLVKERLPADKFAQIKSFDKELGSGSMKVGYLVTLKDGRQVVVMATQEMVLERTMREFEIARAVISAIQADPELRVDNLNVLELEMERIIKTEMNFKREAEMMKHHKMSYEARPWLVRRFGNITDVSIPQPMQDWSSENLLFEEYVKSKKFSQLEENKMFGWSQKDMAKASINEVLNQLLMYMDAPGGVVILDIDPHEENQLAEHTIIGTKKTMVNIDLGQSVLIEPEVVRGLVKAILLVATKRTAESFQVLEKYVNFQNDEQRKLFWEIFYANQEKYKDPVEALTQTLEKVELKGIMLKPEFLYFQKLFATLVGLKRHVNDDFYIIKQVSKLFALRLLGSPLDVKDELVGLLKKTPPDEKVKSITSVVKQNTTGVEVIFCRDLAL